MAKRSKSPTEITSIRHKKDTRVNIPTEELRDFVAEDEKAPTAKDDFVGQQPKKLQLRLSRCGSLPPTN